MAATTMGVVGAVGSAASAAGALRSLGGSSRGRATTTQGPPEWLRPYLEGSVRSAGTLFNRGPTVVPFSPQTEQALGRLNQRSLAGSPVTQAGQDLATRTLRGDFLNSNPFLDATFQRAADASQGRLASEFAGSGRREDDAGGTRSFLRGQQLNDLATSIYGGAFDAERNRQQGILPFVTPLAEADFRDIGAQLGVGNEIEGLGQRFANAQGQSLDDYIRRISGNFGSVTSTPFYRDRFGQAAGGLALAASLWPYGNNSLQASAPFNVSGPYGSLFGNQTRPIPIPGIGG